MSTKVELVRTMSEPERAWLAAAIDGEGSIGLYKKGQGGRLVKVQLANTVEEYVRNARRLVGFGSISVKSSTRPGRWGTKPLYVWQFGGALRVQALLVQIAPYLIVKRARVEAVLKELAEKPFGRWGVPACR